ncbi:MAG: hypothetical protein IBJ18_02045 [Phycisphaerales bacterium]|nr:hypothetical protein [Phycisphaerales bacterium]
MNTCLNATVIESDRMQTKPVWLQIEVHPQYVNLFVLAMIGFSLLYLILLRASCVEHCGLVHHEAHTRGEFGVGGGEGGVPG